MYFFSGVMKVVRTLVVLYMTAIQHSSSRSNSSITIDSSNQRVKRFEMDYPSFPKRNLQHRCCYIFEKRFKDLANIVCGRSIETLNPHRMMLGDLMFDCHRQSTSNVNGARTRDHAWMSFNDAYEMIKLRLTANDDTNSNICQAFLTTRRGLSFHCPSFHRTQNPVMIIFNCMSCEDIQTREIYDTFTGRMKYVDDSGSLLHLAIALDAPPQVIGMLIKDSCGLVLNVRGIANSSCKQPPFGLITSEKASTMSYDSLDNLIYYGLKYMWCLPLLWKHSVWKIVKEISNRPNPFYRSTAHILMDYDLPYFPVIQMGMRYDRSVCKICGNMPRIIANNPFLPDRAGSGHTLLARTVELVESQNLGVGPIYKLIRDDPNGFVNAFFNVSEDVMQVNGDIHDWSDSSDSGSDDESHHDNSVLDDVVQLIEGEWITLREMNQRQSELRTSDIIDQVWG